MLRINSSSFKVNRRKQCTFDRSFQLQGFIFNRIKSVSFKSLLQFTKKHVQCVHGNIIMPILTFVNHSVNETSNPYTSHAPQCCRMRYAVQSNHNSFYYTASRAESYYSKTFINITGVSLCPVMPCPV